MGDIRNRQNPLLLSMMKVICHCCWWSLRVNFFVLIFSFSFFFAFFLFRIILIWFCTNWNLYFLDEESSAEGDGLCYGRFRKKPKQVTEDWGHRFSRDIKLMKEHVEIKGSINQGSIKQGPLVIRFAHGRTSYDV